MLHFFSKGLAAYLTKVEDPDVHNIDTGNNSYSDINPENKGSENKCFSRNQFKVIVTYSELSDSKNQYFDNCRLNCKCNNC